MKVYRAGKVAMAFLGVAYLALVWSQAAQAQVKLEHKFPEGKKLTYKTTAKKHQTLTLMGMEIESGEDRSMVTSITTGKRRGDSALPVERKVESLRVDLSLPGGIKGSYDTTDPKAKIDIPGLAFLDDLFKLEGEVAYTVVLDDHNKVKAIEGTEKLKEKIEKLDPKSQAMVRNEFEADTFKRSFEQELQILPDVLARPGEPWERTQIFEGDDGQTISFRKKFEYLGTAQKGDKMLDKISSKVLEVKCSTDPNSNLDLKIVKSDLKAESSEGTILFDREAGHVVSNKEKVRIKGNITFSAKGMDVPAALDMKIETNVELQPTAK
jgi:Family of unknown function (DUF6263)